MCACVPCERGGCMPGRAMHMPVDLPYFISRVVSVLMCEVRDLSFTCDMHGIGMCVLRMVMLHHCTTPALYIHVRVAV